MNVGRIGADSETEGDRKKCGILRTSADDGVLMRWMTVAEMVELSKPTKIISDAQVECRFALSQTEIVTSELRTAT